MNPCLFVQSLQPASKSRVFSLSLTRSSGILFLFCFSWAASNRNYLPSSSCLKACLSFKTLLLLSCPFWDFAPKSSLLASPSPPIIERHPYLCLSYESLPILLLGQPWHFSREDQIVYSTSGRLLKSARKLYKSCRWKGSSHTQQIPSSISRFLQANQTL